MSRRWSVNAARRLRRDATFPERILWGKLRTRQLRGVKFRRQHPIGPHIADFCCPEVRLVIEVDGESHVGRLDADRAPSCFLEARGFRVMRVTNDEVISDVDSVIEAIDRVCDTLKAADESS